jgi:hypothetical protein
MTTYDATILHAHEGRNVKHRLEVTLRILRNGQPFEIHDGYFWMVTHGADAHLTQMMGSLLINASKTRQTIQITGFTTKYGFLIESARFPEVPVVRKFAVVR